MPRSLIPFCFLLLGCSKPAPPPAQTGFTAPQLPASQAEANLPAIPRTPPELPSGTNVVVVKLTGAPDYSQPEPADGWQLHVRGNDTDASVRADEGDTLTTLGEKLARRFLDDGWMMYLAEEPLPTLFLYLPPGAINLSFECGSGVPGVGVSWSLGG